MWRRPIGFENIHQEIGNRYAAKRRRGGDDLSIGNRYAAKPRRGRDGLSIGNRYAAKPRRAHVVLSIGNRYAAQPRRARNDLSIGSRYAATARCRCLDLSIGNLRGHRRVSVSESIDRTPLRGGTARHPFLLLCLRLRNNHRLRLTDSAYLDCSLESAWRGRNGFGRKRKAAGSLAGRP